MFFRIMKIIVILKILVLMRIHVVLNLLNPLKRCWMQINWIKKFDIKDYSILTLIFSEKNFKDMIVELNHKDTKFSLFCFFFESCQFGKHKQSTFPLSQSKVEAPLELIHHDEWGLAPVMLNEGSKYCIHFLDDFSRFTWNFPLKTKSDVFVKFHKLVESQFDGRVKMFHSDWGGVYKFHSLFKRKWLRF